MFESLARFAQHDTAIERFYLGRTPSVLHVAHKKPKHVAKKSEASSKSVFTAI